jgi:hypothetical protein
VTSCRHTAPRHSISFFFYFLLNLRIWEDQLSSPTLNQKKVDIQMHAQCTPSAGNCHWLLQARKGGSKSLLCSHSCIQWSIVFPISGASAFGPALTRVTLRAFGENLSYGLIKGDILILHDGAAFCLRACNFRPGPDDIVERRAFLHMAQLGRDGFHLYG